MKLKMFTLAIMLFSFAMILAEDIKVSAFTFEHYDSKAKYVVKKLDKDFDSLIDDMDGFEYVKMKKADKALKKKGAESAMAAGKELIAEVAKELGAELIIWGNISSKTKTEFDASVNIMTVKTGAINTKDLVLVKKTSDRKDVLQKEIFANLKTFLTGDIEQDLAIAKRNYANKNWIEAKKVFERLMEKDASIEEIYIYLPFIYLQLNENDKCIKFSQKAIEKFDEDDSVYHMYIAASYQKLENYEQAIESFKTAAELRKDTPEEAEKILLTVAKIYSEDIEDEEETLEAYKAVIELNPESKVANLKLADLYYDATEFETAIPYLEKTVELFPGVAIYEKKLGKAYKETGATDSAIENYKKQIAKDPKNEKAYLNLANMYSMGERYDEAIATLLDLKKVNPESIKMLMLLAKSYLAKKDNANAKKYANQIIVKNSTLPEPYFMLAQMNFTLGYAKYTKFNELDDKSRNDKTIVGADADKLIAQRDKVKAEANAILKKSMDNFKKTKARSGANPEMKKLAVNYINQLKTLVKATEKTFFD